MTKAEENVATAFVIFMLLGFVSTPVMVLLDGIGVVDIPIGYVIAPLGVAAFIFLVATTVCLIKEIRS